MFNYIRSMKRYVAFLRGINVSGHNIIKMEQLREMLLLPGFKNLITYIQSGNVAFDAKETDTDVLRKKIGKKLLKDLGYEVTTIVRSVEELQSVIANNPFATVQEADKRKLYITFLEAIPDSERMKLLNIALAAGEEFRLVGRELYILTPAYGETKFSNNFIEKKLGLRATTRNSATVNKMTQL
jgi:uncharacterized protein (DUF1697 family)